MDGTAKKRKRVEPPDKENNNQELPYILNRIRSLQKKLDSTTQENSIIFKGNTDNLQLVVVCNTALYELLKSIFKLSLQEQGLFVSTKVNKDLAKSVVALVVSVKNKKKGKSLFTANFYNTTSTILVNGIKEPSQFLDQYTTMVSNIPESTIKSLNETIQRSCRDVISNSTTPYKEMNASKISLPDTISTISSQHSSTSINMYSSNVPEKQPSSEPNLATTSNASTSSAYGSYKSDGCKLCHKINDNVHTMMNKLLELENCVKQQNSLIQSLMLEKQPILGFLKEEMTKLTNNVNSKLECLSYTNPQSNSTLECLPKTVPPSPVPSTSQQIWSNFDHSKLNTRNLNNQNSQLSTTRQFYQTTSHISPTKANQTVPTQSTGNGQEKKNQNRSFIDFKPNQNIIVNLNKDSNIVSHFDPDVVRRTVSHSFGPVIIEKITKYKYASERPKLAIQFKDQQTAVNIVSNWKPTIFGSSTARTTIDPKSLTENCVMMYGVPIDCADDDIQSDIVTDFNGAIVQRLTKNGERLRTFKITFSSTKHYNQALSNGILLKSQIIKCQCRPLNG